MSARKDEETQTNNALVYDQGDTHALKHTRKHNVHRDERHTYTHLSLQRCIVLCMFAQGLTTVPQRAARRILKDKANFGAHPAGADTRAPETSVVAVRKNTVAAEPRLTTACPSVLICCNFACVCLETMQQREEWAPKAQLRAISSSCCIGLPNAQPRVIGKSATGRQVRPPEQALFRSNRQQKQMPLPLHCCFAAFASSSAGKLQYKLGERQSSEAAQQKQWYNAIRALGSSTFR